MPFLIKSESNPVFFLSGSTVVEHELIENEDGIFKPQNVQLVLLDRTKKRRANVVLGYRLWTTDGNNTYIETKDIPNWTKLVEVVYEKKMIYANNNK